MTPVSGPSPVRRRAVPPEGDEVDVGGVEHDLDRHQHGDRVAPEEHADQADRERGRGEVEEPVQRDVVVLIAVRRSRGVGRRDRAHRSASARSAHGPGAVAAAGAAGPVGASVTPTARSADRAEAGRLVVAPRGRPARSRRPGRPSGAGRRPRTATTNRVTISLPTVRPMLLIAVGTVAERLARLGSRSAAGCVGSPTRRRLLLEARSWSLIPKASTRNRPSPGDAAREASSRARDRGRRRPPGCSGSA